MPTTQARNPMTKIAMFLLDLQIKCSLVLSEFQCAAESIIAGAIRERVDILTAPSRDTRSSSQGTVAASPTVKTTSII